MNIMGPLSKEEIEKIVDRIEDGNGKKWGASLSLSVKIICVHPETSKIVMVKNQEKEIAPGKIKKSMWELPGGGVHLKQSESDETMNETPKAAAIRELSQETGFSILSFEIDGILGGFQKHNIKNKKGSQANPYHYDIVLLAHLKEMTIATPGRVTSDPTEGTLAWDWVDPTRQIRERNGRYYYEMRDRNEQIHTNSMMMINRFIFCSEDGD